MITYKKYENSYLDELLQLLQPLWGHLSLEQRKAYFDWKYFKNPLCPISNAFIAIDQGKLIAFRGYFFQKYESNSKTVLVAAISDALVHPDYQGRGVFKELTMYSMKKLSSSKMLYMTISNDTWRTSKTYLKLGSQPLGDKNVLYNLSSLFIKTNTDITIEKSSVFNFNFFNRVNKQVSDKIKLSADADYWGWRYNNPCSNYEFLYLSQNNTPVGFISFYKISKYRVFILDYKLESTSYLKDVLNYLKKREGILLSQLWSTSKSNEEKKELKNIGFKSYKLLKRIKKGTLPPVLIRPGKITIEKNDWKFAGLDIRDEKNWHLNLICSDGV